MKTMNVSSPQESSGASFFSPKGGAPKGAALPGVFEASLAKVQEPVDAAVAPEQEGALLSEALGALLRQALRVDQITVQMGDAAQGETLLAPEGGEPPLAEGESTGGEDSLLPSGEELLEKATLPLISTTMTDETLLSALAVVQDAASSEIEGGVAAENIPEDGALSVGNSSAEGKTPVPAKSGPLPEIITPDLEVLLPSGGAVGATDAASSALFGDIAEGISLAQLVPGEDHGGREGISGASMEKSPRLSGEDKPAVPEDVATGNLRKQGEPLPEAMKQADGVFLETAAGLLSKAARERTPGKRVEGEKSAREKGAESAEPQVEGVEPEDMASATRVAAVEKSLVSPEEGGEREALATSAVAERQGAGDELQEDAASSSSRPKSGMEMPFASRLREVGHEGVENGREQSGQAAETPGISRGDSGVGMGEMPARRNDSMTQVASSPLPAKNQSALFEGMTQVVKFAATSEGHRAHVVVDPPALGRVDVILQTTGNGLEGTLRVDNEILRQTLQGQLDSLRNALAQQGVTVSQLSVDVRQDERREGDRSRDSREKKTGRVERPSWNLDGEDEETAVARLDLEQGLLHWVA